MIFLGFKSRITKFEFHTRKIPVAQTFRKFHCLLYPHLNVMKGNRILFLYNKKYAKLIIKNFMSKNEGAQNYSIQRGMFQK